MSREFSLYLDAVRVLAAVFVVLSHTNLRTLTADVPVASDYGHTAVVVFFVLSGYVISLTATTKEKTGRQYAVNRIARISSVAVPALLLAPLLDGVGQKLNPAIYVGQTTQGFWWLRILAGLTLSNEVWGLSIQAFSNAPFWSISYEGWYYILFGLLTYYQGHHKRLVLFVAALLCGPKILLLLPVWLMGLFLQRSAVANRLSRRSGAVLYVASMAMFVAFHALGAEAYFRRVVAALVGIHFQLDWMTYSGGFLGDYVLGAIVALNFAAFRAAAVPLGWPLLRFEGVIRWTAGLTLSLYLFHRPLLLFFMALLRGDPQHSLFLVETLMLVALAVVVLGALTERQRHGARNLVDGGFSLFMRAKRWPSRAAASGVGER